MATKYKVLGQSAPSATTATTLYTVPSSTYAVVSTITVANRGTGNATYRIAVRPNAATLANQHYIAYDATVPPNDTIALTLGLTADAADLIEVYGSTADLSFNAFGSEIDE
jgi:hypothetical protein